MLYRHETTKICSTFINKGNTQEKYKLNNEKNISELYKTFAFTIQYQNEKSMERCILLVFSFVCFATFMVQNLPARKIKKNKEMA
jgi:hypothetical protein